MQSSTIIIFFVITSIEAVLIVIGNSLAIYVFWSQIHHQRRTCFLLINLAVADLLMGITEPIVLATDKIPRLKISGAENDILNPSSAVQVLASSTSVFFLALASVERVYAVVRPFRFRLTESRVYVFSALIVWVFSFCMAGLLASSIYYTKVDGGIILGTLHVLLVISLLVICVSYLKIRTRLRRTPAEIATHSGRSTERNLHLSRTVFTVIAVSLVLWVPPFIVYSIRGFCSQCLPLLGFWVVNPLHLANSMVNPFVYTFRMPVFKHALKKLWRKQRKKVETRPAKGNTRTLNAQGSFTTHF